MRIDIGALLAGKTGSVSFDERLPRPDGFDGIEFEDEVSVSGVIKNSAGYISLSAELSVPYRTNCARCAAVITGTFTKSFSRVLTTRAEDKNPGSGERADDYTDDYIVISDDSVELLDPVLEEIFLGFDSVYYCRPDCKGLCPVCGKDLNTGDCGCSSKKEIDPRLLPLAALLKEDEEAGKE